MKKIFRALLMFVVSGMPLCAWALTNCERSIFCRTLRVYNKFNWFHEPFSKLFDIANNLATDVCETMRPIFLSFLGLGFLFWLLFRVGKVVVDITPSADGQLVPDIFKKLLRVIIGSLLLSFYVSVFTFLICPALEMTLGVGNTISLDQMLGSKKTGNRLNFDLPKTSDGKTLCQDYTDAVKNTKSGDSVKQVFSNTVKQAFLCYIDIGHYTMANGMAIGSTAVTSWAGYNIIDKVRRIQLLVIGIIIFLAHFLLMLSFPTKLFDPLVTLIFLSTLFPLWVVLWVFEPTKKYYEKARDLFIGVLVHLIVISIVTVMVIQVMNSALGGKDIQEKVYVKLMAGEDAFSVFTKTEGFGLMGISVVFTFSLAWLAVKMFGKISPLAGQFENVVDFGVGKSAATYISTGTSLVSDMGKNAVAATYHGTKGGLSKLAQRDDMLGKATRGLGTALAGAAVIAAAPTGLGVLAGLGAAAAAHRFMPVPKNRPHGSSWTDRLGVETYEDDDNLWKVNKSGEQSSRQDRKTKEWEKYNRRTQIYEEFDNVGRLQNVYDRNHGQISLMGQKYEFSIDKDGVLTIEMNGEKYSVDASGTVKNLISSLPVSDKKAKEVKNVAEFQRHAERRVSEHEGMLTA